MMISNHARKRMKERCGFNKKTCDRMAKKAFTDGIAHKQTRGRLNKWVTSLFFKNCNANNIRIYGDNAYIFCGETLVTVIPVPADLRKDLDRMVERMEKGGTDQENEKSDN